MLRVKADLIKVKKREEHQWAQPGAQTGAQPGAQGRSQERRGAVILKNSIISIKIDV